MTLFTIVDHQGLLYILLIKKFPRIWYMTKNTREQYLPLVNDNISSNAAKGTIEVKSSCLYDFLTSRAQLFSDKSKRFEVDYGQLDQCLSNPQQYSETFE
ncbi:hypothetical protein A0J61_06134 [Choanephora cucurbitarum]|uniref:Uncharacterized protein n=1 Tax=Choanephora cucurbitarum TaxID=101091 RepID=A0A1C7N9N8_9FUNG|nr:hypothetical protein A0J61_06134 [Choanephora cucurbitarum]